MLVIPSLALDAKVVAVGSFNPYHAWLELNESLSSPNHFELLGLDESEQDAKAIAMAADRTASRVRRCRPGEHAAAWAALLDQIAEAKKCLTDPQRRSEYVRSLETGVAANETRAAVARVAPQGSVDPNMYPPGLAPAMAPVSPPAAVESRNAQPLESMAADTAWSPPPARAAAQNPADWNNPLSPSPVSPPSPHSAFDPQAAVPMQPYGAVGGLPMSPAGVPYLQPADPSSLADPMRPALPATGYMSGTSPMSPAAGMDSNAGMPGFPAPLDPMAAMPLAAYPNAATPMSGNPMAANPMAANPMAAMPMGMPVPPPAIPTAQPLSGGAPAYPMAMPLPATPLQAVASGGEPNLAVSNSSAILLAQRNQSGAMVPILLGLGVGLTLLGIGGAYFYFTAPPGANSDRVASADTPPNTEPGLNNEPATRGEFGATHENPRPTRAGAPPAIEFNSIAEGDSSQPRINGTPTNVSSPAAAEMKTAESKGSTDSKPNVPAATSSNPSTDLPKPADPPKPEVPVKPDAKPAMDPKASPATETPTKTDDIPQPKKEDLIKLGRAMTKAREAIGEHEFDRAEAFISVAEEMPHLPMHQAMLDRLKLLSESVGLYRTAIQTSISKLSSGSSFNVGEAAVGVVETSPEKVIFRVNGQNRSYNLGGLPVGLAAALAAQTLADDDPNTLTLKGAYVMASPRASQEDLKKAREFLAKAAASVDSAKELLLLFEDKYDLASTNP